MQAAMPLSIQACDSYRIDVSSHSREAATRNQNSYSYLLQDVLLYYGAKEYGSKPEALGQRSPRESYNPQAEGFLRERGSYQHPPEHP